MRKTLSIIFAIASAVTIFLAVLNNPNSAKLSVDETIANSRKIHQSFSMAVNFTNTFERMNGRLPNEAEFNDWVKLQSNSVHSPREMFIETDLEKIKRRLNKREETSLHAFPTPNNGSYLIGLWRGEWNEYYASWQRETTLELDPKAYYLFGTAMKDFAFLIFLFLIFTAASIWLWLSSKKLLKAKENG